MEELRNFLLVSVVLVFIYVFYRWVLRMMRNREIIKKPYPYVYPFASRRLEGEVEVWVDMPSAGEVEVKLVADNGENRVLHQGNLSPGKVHFAVVLDGVRPGEYTWTMTFTDSVVQRFVVIGEGQP